MKRHLREKGVHRESDAGFVWFAPAVVARPPPSRERRPKSGGPTRPTPLLFPCMTRMTAPPSARSANRPAATSRPASPRQPCPTSCNLPPRPRRPPPPSSWTPRSPPITAAWPHATSSLNRSRSTTRPCQTGWRTVPTWQSGAARRAPCAMWGPRTSLKACGWAWSWTPPQVSSTGGIATAN